MRRFLAIIPAMIMVFGTLNPAWSAGEQALKLRELNGLKEFTPPESFLNGNFVADEIEPQYVFGKVKDFRKARSCPAGWFIEENELKRISDPANLTVPIEYTVYLEEDCPGKITYFVFVDRSRAKSAQWMEWRKLFHRSKAEEQYGGTNTLLEQAAQSGFPVDAELRFVEIGGELVPKKAEDFLTGDLKVRPIYDLRRGSASNNADK